MSAEATGGASTSSSRTLLSCSTLISYLKTLDTSTLQQLYNHPATCLAVFRELPALGKQYVMRLLYVEQAVPKAVVSSWTVAGNSRTSEASFAAVSALTTLGIWQETAMPGGLPAWILDNTFRNNLKIVLVGGGDPWAMMRLDEDDPYMRTESFLDQYSSERWDTVLHYMVGSKQQTGISHDAVCILIHSGLMRVSPDGDGTHCITKSGFQFLLMETSSQVWYFILQYLDTVATRNLSLVECLNFLFQLSFAKFGKDYSTVGLSQGILKFLQHLREFGLVYQRKRTAGRFYPTRLVMNIASGEKKGMMERHKDGFLVVETNYRVYAYTSSDLQVALLGLFAEVLYRFPNLAVAVITRDSVRQAFKGGITSAQITRFLRMHTHPRQQAAHMKNGEAVIPPTVIDQIALWEAERNRFTFTDGVLYNQFLSLADYETVRNFAESINVCVLANSKQRVVVVTKEGHEPVKKFWKRHSRQH